MFSIQVKPSRLRQRLLELVLQLLPGSIRWQIQQIETGVSHGEVIDIADLLNNNRHSRHALDRNSVTACQEHQEFAFFFFGKVVLENGPEMIDSWVVSAVALLNNKKLSINNAITSIFNSTHFISCIFLKLFPIVIFISNNQIHQLLWMKQLQNGTTTNLYKKYYNVKDTNILLYIPC